MPAGVSDGAGRAGDPKAGGACGNGVEAVEKGLEGALLTRENGGFDARVVRAALLRAYTACRCREAAPSVVGTADDTRASPARTHHFLQLHPQGADPATAFETTSFAPAAPCKLEASMAHG